MTFLNALVLGLIRGAAGVLPVSSSGLSAMAGRLMGADIGADPLFAAMTGLGVLMAVAAVWHREILKVMAALGGIVIDLIANLLILILGKNTRYRRIVTGAYRKITVMLLISIIPSVIISCLAGSYAASLYGSLLVSSIGMLLTAMLLLVSSFVMRQNKGPKEAGPFAALTEGLFYGFSVFPGVSRIGTAYAGGLIGEFTPRFTVTYAHLLYFFTGIFSVIAGIANGVGVQAGTKAVSYIVGTAAAAASGYFVLKLFGRRFRSRNCIGFAVFGAVAGVLLLILYFV